MKKLFAAAALALLAFSGAAQAALVTVTFRYEVNFVDSFGNFASDTGLSTGSFITGSAVYEDSAFVPDQLNSVDSFNLNFGNFNFTKTDDLLGDPVIRLGASGNLAELLFETYVTLGSPTPTGTYLLSFVGDEATLSAGLDNVLTASAVPLPAALPLLMAGLGLFGVYGRRRKQK